jgi:hypothetical protein
MTNLTERQQLGRAQNAISAYLTRKLSLPKIYLDASWNQQAIDLLAIDRSGVGDVHAVRMILREPNPEAGQGGESVLTVTAAGKAVEQMHRFQSQFRYIAVVSNLPYALDPTFSWDFREKTKTFAEDGVGRIGVLYLDVFGDDARVDEIVKPERFRSSKEILDLTDEYVATHTANMEYRDPSDYEVHA